MLKKTEPKEYTKLKKAEHLIRALCEVYSPEMSEDDISKFFRSLSNDSEVIDRAMTIWTTAIAERV